MKKIVIVLMIFAILAVYAGAVFAGIEVVPRDKETTTTTTTTVDSSTVDLRDKDTSKPVPLLR